MSKPSCNGATLVEAMFDGRLGPSERASTERHLKGCGSCQALLVELGSLQALLRSSAASVVSPLDHQRARLALLRQGAGPLVVKRRPMALLVAALLTVPLAVFAATSASSPARSWYVNSTAVKKLASPKHARLPITTQPIPPALPAPSATTKSPQVAPIAAPVAVASAISRASLDFSDAMQALSRSDFGASARKLHAFAAAHPRDPRVQDATYLEAIALQRAGRLADAAATARRYLALYPNGTHRAPARRIAGD